MNNNEWYCKLPCLKICSCKGVLKPFYWCGIFCWQSEHDDLTEDCHKLRLTQTEERSKQKSQVLALQSELEQVQAGHRNSFNSLKVHVYPYPSYFVPHPEFVSIHNYMSAAFVGWPSAESRWSSSSHNFLSFSHYFRKYFKLMCRKDVVMVTLTMFLPFTCMCFWVGNFTKVVCLCTTTYEVIHDCRKSEKHWCRVVLGNLITNHLVNKFPILWNQRFITMFRKVILCILSLAIWMACTYSPSFSKIHFHIIILNTVWEPLLYDIFLKVKFIICKFSWNTSLVFKSSFPLFLRGGGC
jgi:hypothetical protein